MLTTPTVLLKDDFRQGLDLTRIWALLRVPPSLIADDGIASASDRGLYVRAAGTNTLTGEPAFAKTWPAENDHVKSMGDTQHLSSNSMPASTRSSARSCKSTCGRAVGHSAPRHTVRKRRDKPSHRPAHRDVRVNALDLEPGMVFDGG